MWGRSIQVVAFDYTSIAVVNHDPGNLARGIFNKFNIRLFRAQNKLSVRLGEKPAPVIAGKFEHEMLIPHADARRAIEQPELSHARFKLIVRNGRFSPLDQTHEAIQSRHQFRWPL